MKTIITAVMLAYITNIYASQTFAERRDISLRGHVGKLLSLCVKNHIAETDPLYLTSPFHARQEASLWQSEFWGKWMHSAVPLAGMAGDTRIDALVASGLEDILSTQDESGYIGNYRSDRRYGHGCWDVWGTKYTLMGLLVACGPDSRVDQSLRKDALDAAVRLADCLMRSFGDVEGDSFTASGEKLPLCRTGWYKGMPSCSVLEPIVLIYRATGAKRYLDFARYIVEQMDDDAGARLMKDCDVPVFDRVTNGHLDSSLKAYEMMSCYQGMLELADVLRETGNDADAKLARKMADAAICTAEHILREEINIVGGSASGEHWYNGKARQVWNYNRQNETCVLTTWMRLCGKLYSETADTKWIDALEQCFYNAYLSTMKSDGSVFSQYFPLAGTRTTGEHHCRMQTNCCNANGPRGFLCFLDAMLSACGDTVSVSLYSSGHASVYVPALDEKVSFQMYTEYPKTGCVEIWYRSKKTRKFVVEPRVPGWCRRWTLKLGEQVVLDSTSTDRPWLDRVWNPGDKICLEMEMPVVSHVLDGHVCFTRGPIVLARDARWGRDIADTVRPCFAGDGSGETKVPDFSKMKLDFRPVDSRAVWMAFDAVMPMGTHSESVDGKLPSTVRFVDFSSAGGTWDSRSAYRTWLPLLRFEARR